MASEFPTLNQGDFLREDQFEKGSFGVVFKAVWKSNGDKRVAIKDILKTPYESEELELLAHAKHRNIVLYFGHYESADEYSLVFELAEAGDLHDFIGGSPLPEKDAVKIAMDVACGLCYLHNESIIHRDLKSKNVLIFKEPDTLAKISDFGLAKIYPQTAEMTHRGTLIFMSPEMARGQKEEISEASDCWSFGCVLLNMVTGKEPFHEIDDLSHVIRALDSNEHPAIPDGYDGCFRNMIEDCLDKDAIFRPKIMNINFGLQLKSLGMKIMGEQQFPSIVEAGLSIIGRVCGNMGNILTAFFHHPLFVSSRPFTRHRYESNAQCTEEGDDGRVESLHERSSN